MARTKKIVKVVEEEVPVEVVEDVVEDIVEVPVVPKVETSKGDIVLDSPLEKTVSVLGFATRVLGVELFKSCRLAVTIKCVSLGREYTDYKELVLEGEDYSKWSADDDYIIQFVISKLPELI